MPNLISSSEALQALQAGPCRVARESWPWGKWIERGLIKVAPKSKPEEAFSVESILLYENDQPTSQLWEPEFADHSADDWYVLEERF